MKRARRSELRGLIILLAVGICLSFVSGDAQAADEMVYDFETPGDVTTWVNLDVEDEYNAVTIEQSSEHAYSGTSSLKLTYTGGIMPTVGTVSIPITDWYNYKYFRASVYVPRDGMVVFRGMCETSGRSSSWEDSVGRWERAALVKAGHNDVVGTLNSPNEFPSTQGALVQFEIAFYDSIPGESIYVDAIRITTDTIPQSELPESQYQGGHDPEPGSEFNVLGESWIVESVHEVADIMQPSFTVPDQKTITQVEAEFDAAYDALKLENPRVVKAIFRQGQAGYDPLNPGDVYDGWQDSYMTSHGPETIIVYNSKFFSGSNTTKEFFMRHRCAILKADFSSIPDGSEILDARFVATRTDYMSEDRNYMNPRNMWVAEAVRRPWVESEVNNVQYAKHAYWNNHNAKDWGGEDPDCYPTFIAYGHGQGEVNVFDFTEALNFWMEPDKTNHGFLFHSTDEAWLVYVHMRESSSTTKRPTFLVIYDPSPSPDPLPPSGIDIDYLEMMK